MTVQTSPTAGLERIPVIRIGALRGSDAAARKAVAREIGTACREVGFFYIADHGVPDEKIVATHAAARTFFALPIEQRLEIEATREHYRGYMPIGARTYGADARTDLVHAFKMQLELAADDPDVLAGKPLHQLNKWPRGLPGWRETLLDYWGAMEGLTDALLRGFALAVDAEEDAFLPFFRKPLAQLSLLHYPPQPPDAPEGQFGIRPHSDTSAFTILWTDDVGGLQIRPRGMDWIAAPSLPGTFIINIGDMMARWTNDIFLSTPHRVLNLTGRERFSIPFFANPDYDAVVTCLPECQSPDRPAVYPPQHVGEFIAQRFTANWATRPR
jgi:isopenicillin N synthase-like dioxygenase